MKRRNVEDLMLLAVAVFVLWAWSQPERPLRAACWSLEGTMPCAQR